LKYEKDLLCGILASVLMLSGCSTYQYTSRQTNVQREDITMSPTIVDVRPDYEKRIEVTSGWCKTKETAMDECRYIAIVNNKIDVVVDPIFKVEYRKGHGPKKYKATLTGFAGYYTNSRTLFEDIERLKNFSREDIEKYLILQNPEVLKYMNKQGDVVNIYHTENEALEKVSTPTIKDQNTKK
jgi:uncharacterized lipoprotein YajG